MSAESGAIGQEWRASGPAGHDEVGAAFVAAAERALAAPDLAGPSDDALERVLTAAVRLYAARAEARDSYPAPLSAGQVTATDVATVVSEMIRVVDMNLFDLSMWHRRGNNRG